jgi:outer membrane protein W/outer membrane protein OmpA-like peptidoglycan-associated protein
MSKIKSLSASAAFVAVTSLLGATAAAEQGDWLVRAGASVVDPKSDNLTLGPTTTLQVDEDTQITFDVTYMFRRNWGVELLASNVWNHGLFLKTPTGTTGLGEVEHLPPTLSLQYHFNPDGRFRPYAGVGLNYTFLYNEKPSALSVDNSFGPAAQLGVDVGLTDKWFLNLSARYIDIDGDARLGGTSIGTVEVDPFVYGIHVGYKFGRPAPVMAAPVAAVAPPPPPAPPADSDGDGVVDPSDACPGTARGAKVDARGCELDTDADGVVDSADRCPGTPPATKVDEFGCSLTARLEVFFDNNSAVLKPESYPELDTVVKFMTDVPRVAGVLEGHTDSVGSAALNERLSQRRADAVRTYLVSKGIDGARIEAKGFGESRPEADNATPEGRARNRRVVLQRTDTP